MGTQLGSPHTVRPTALAGTLAWLPINITRTAGISFTSDDSPLRPRTHLTTILLIGTVVPDLTRGPFDAVSRHWPRTRVVRSLDPHAERARRFYADMFNWSIEGINDDYSLIGGGDGEPIGGIGQAGPHSPYVGLTTYFPTADVEPALVRAEQLGGTRVFGPFTTPMGTIGAFADPDGNTVGVISP